MNYIHELTTIVVNEVLLRLRKHKSLLTYYKLYYRRDQKTNTTAY